MQVAESYRIVPGDVYRRHEIRTVRREGGVVAEDVGDVKCGEDELNDDFIP